MKKLAFITICLFLHTNTWALNEYATLDSDSKKFVTIIKNELELGDDDAYTIFDTYIKHHLDTKDWSYNYFDNETSDISRTQKSKNKTIYLNFVSDNRFTNISLIKFAAEKQIQVHSIETLPRNTQLAIEKYKELKNDSAYSLDLDKTEFSIFSRKNYTKKIKIMLNSGVGSIQYIDFYTHNITK